MMAFDQLKTIETPNSRLVYYQVESPSEPWLPYLGDLINKLENIPNVQLANEKTYLYFFKSSSEKDFYESAYWVGREIIGFIPENDLQGAKSYDLYHSKAFSFDLSLESELGKILSGELYRAEQQLRSLAGSQLAPTWRVCLAKSSEQEKNWRLSIQFFQNS
ncbi:hypothetical protein OAT67_07045 [Bacteriovoracaceae bacterium]|nr:hypothetical protein [Bacteriovoracaceae bacterium]